MESLQHKRRNADNGVLVEDTMFPNAKVGLSHLYLKKKKNSNNTHIKNTAAKRHSAGSFLLPEGEKRIVY